MFRWSLNNPGHPVNRTAKRQYKAAYELPQDIDVSASEAKLETGVLTLKLVKLKPEGKATKLTIN